MPNIPGSKSMGVSLNNVIYANTGNFDFVNLDSNINDVSGTWPGIVDPWSLPPPISCFSRSLVRNLNVEYLGGKTVSDILAHSHQKTDLPSSIVYTDQDNTITLGKLLKVGTTIIADTDGLIPYS